MGTLTVTVTDSSNKPVQGASVDAKSALSFGYAIWGPWEGKGTTDANGIAKIGTPLLILELLPLPAQCDVIATSGFNFGKSTATLDPLLLNGNVGITITIDPSGWITQYIWYVVYVLVAIFALWLLIKIFLNINIFSWIKKQFKKLFGMKSSPSSSGGTTITIQEGKY